MCKIILSLATFVGLVLSASQQPVLAQIESTASETSQKSGSSKTFEARFWQYLLSNNYKNWAPPAGQGGGFFESASVHGKLHKLYLNRTAASDPDALTDESIIVMENYQRNKTLESISVMLRSEGSNPLQKDWYWITFGPDGSVIGSAEQNNSEGPVQLKPNASFVNTTGSMVVGSSCTQCHRKAPGDDYVYFNSNDQTSSPNEISVELSR